MGYGPGPGMVMSASVPLRMVELSTTRPVRLPWVLRGLGSFAFETFLSELDAPRHRATSKLWGMAVQWNPHPRLALGFQRGVMFGTDGYPGSLKDFLLMSLMLKNGRENNVLSATFRYRVPAESWLPLTAYGEWATDDGDGGYLWVPGLRFGMELPAVPFLPLLSVGAEYSFIGTIAVRHFPWYGHSRERGGWVSEDRPLGHPLGGNGRELRAYASLPLFGAALGFDVSVFRRQRFYDNLYSPMREGVSLGGNAALRWKPLRNLELSVAGEREDGDRWSNTIASGRMGLVF